MALDRKEKTATAAIARRSAAAVQRSPAPAGRPAARALQERLGNQGTQLFVARAVQQPKSTRLPAKVSKPHESAELEAEEAARKVVRMREPPPVKPAAPKQTTGGALQRAEAAPPASVPRAPALRVQVPGGAPLPPSVRGFMEPRFGASFAHVRIHTDDAAAQHSANLNAQAFTVGEHVFFGRDKFQPQSASGRELIAHELVHTVQQGGGVQRAVAVTQRSEPRPQRFGISDALDWIADKAYLIPGFRLLTIVLGMNPINWQQVDRSAANILRALLELIPGVGPLIVQALDNYGIFDKVGAWMEGKVRTLGLVGSALKQGLDKFLDSLSWSDIFDLDDVYERGKRIFTDPIDQLIALGKSVVGDILEFIRQAILLPLAKLAEGTRGYDLLKAVLEQDPVTGQPYPRTPENLIGGFMKFIGQEEVWENIQKAKAIPRAWAWFKDAIRGLVGFVSQIPTVFLNALKSLEIIDLLLPPKAFLKLAGVFGSFVMQFFSWAGSTVWNLLEIVFDVVSPGALGYLKKTGEALKNILAHPIAFVGNLVRAAKLGFTHFRDRFSEHLQKGLIDWLVGALPGVYIPKALTLVEIGTFAFSVLGLTWANIRQKLVTAVGETAVKAMETTFEIVVTLVRGGPAAAWEKIKEQLSNLKQMVIDGIVKVVVDAVVHKAIPKLLAMFIPGAGFISAILSIYDTIMVFVHKIAKLVEVVRSFVDSIVAIAAGAVEAAAGRVETALSGLLTLAINFLAGFAGLGDIASKVLAVIETIRAPINKALDWLVNWIVTAAKTLWTKGKAAVKKVFAWAFATKTFRDDEGKSHSLYVNAQGGLTVESTPMAAGTFVDWYVKERNGDKELAKEIKKLVGTAEKVVAGIEKARGGGDDPPAPDKQRELLALNTEISGLLATLVSGDTKVGQLEQKYLLEGQVGTYATIPKPVGDKLTPDHQPQAAVILAAADFFRDTLGIDGGELSKRAEGRAAQGYAINLHFRRHVAGATYGSKGETREGFREKLVKAARSLRTKAEKKQVASDMLRAEVKKDAAQMKTVVAHQLKDEAWKQLGEELPETKAKKLKKEIGDRIVKGEEQIVSQPFDF
jgi:hypothetical protein